MGVQPQNPDKISSTLLLFLSMCLILLNGCGSPAPTQSTTKIEKNTTATIEPIYTPSNIAAGRPSNAQNLEEYKREVAHAILQANPKQHFTGVVPPMLRSVTIVKLLINHYGHTQGTSILRSAGLPELDQIVLNSIQAASPLPAPRPEWLNKQGGVEYTETWLMRDDKRFQLRTISAPQAYGGR